MKKIATLTLLILTLGMIGLFAPIHTPVHAIETVHAQGESETLKEATFDVSDILNPTYDEDREDRAQDYFVDNEETPIVAFILKIINFALQIIGTIAMIILIVGGFMMMIAQGNQQKLDEAKDVIKYALIGILVTFMSYVIVIFVQSLFTSI